MKAHLYLVRLYEADFIFREAWPKQRRLYFPAQGVVAYRTEELIDGFFDDCEDIKEAEDIISGAAKNKGTYLGAIEVPDDLVSKIISASRKMNESIENFYQATKPLIKQIERGKRELSSSF